MTPWMPRLPLARVPSARLEALTDQRLAHYVREELLPFSAGYSALLERAGLGRSGVRGVRDLARVPAVTAEDLLAAEREPDARASFVLRPDPAALGRSAGWLRRLALRLGGPRAQRTLAWAYAPVLSTGAPGPTWLLTPHDVDLAGESGARALGELGLDRPAERTLVLTSSARRIETLALLYGAVQAGARIEFADPEVPAQLVPLARGFTPTAVVGRPADLARCFELADLQPLRELRALVVVTPALSSEERAHLAERARAVGAPRGVAVAALLALDCTRLVFAERLCADDAAAGFVLCPDLGVFERLEASNELVYSAAAGHGLPAFRFRTGLGSEHGISRPAVGPPRLAADLRPVSGDAPAL